MILGNHFIFFELKQYPISQPTLPELAGGVAHSYEGSFLPYYPQNPPATRIALQVLVILPNAEIRLPSLGNNLV